jgi:HD-GYP domain-containing protein (c-di-GMP phosphodiesterase class II)
MTQDRPYRRALSLDTSLDFLAEKSGTQFCPSVVEAVHKNLNQIIKLVIA